MLNNPAEEGVREGGIEGEKEGGGREGDRQTVTIMYTTISNYNVGRILIA